MDSHGAFSSGQSWSPVQVTVQSINGAAPALVRNIAIMSSMLANETSHFHPIGIPAVQALYHED